MRAVYCCYNPFTKEDVRAEVSVAGGPSAVTCVESATHVHAYVTAGTWRQLHVAGVLRAFRAIRLAAAALASGADASPPPPPLPVGPAMLPSSSFNAAERAVTVAGAAGVDGPGWAGVTLVDSLPRRAREQSESVGREDGRRHVRQRLVKG